MLLSGGYDSFPESYFYWEGNTDEIPFLNVSAHFFRLPALRKGRLWIHPFGELSLQIPRQLRLHNCNRESRTSIVHPGILATIWFGFRLLWFFFLFLTSGWTVQQQLTAWQFEHVLHMSVIPENLKWFCHWKSLYLSLSLNRELATWSHSFFFQFEEFDLSVWSKFDKHPFENCWFSCKKLIWNNKGHKNQK